MKVLVTGAAGYIGSHVALALERAGHDVVALDDMSTGHRALLRGRPCVEASLLDRGAVREALRGVDSVAHLAGSALVPESVKRPELYWRNNLGAGLTLVEEMLSLGVLDLVFSSTCAVYGTPAVVPIREDAPHLPITPYGASKAAFERLLGDVRAAHGLRTVIFRYFNAAGCDASAGLGELHEPETHVIPNVLRSLDREREPFTIFGTDFETPDGTCLRDYVDVRDIARAHVMAIESLRHDDAAAGLACHLGSGKGTSVREIVAACELVTGRRIDVVEGSRRMGDPAELVASVERAPRVLGWRPENDLHSMIAGAWQFVQDQAAAP